MIMNLTQHTATSAQVTAGVVEPSNKEEIKKLLTFSGVPTQELILERAKQLACYALEAEQAMIGGYLPLMAPLARELRALGITPLFSHTERVTIEGVDAAGNPVKTSKFEHVGFVEAVQ